MLANRRFLTAILEHFRKPCDRAPRLSPVDKARKRGVAQHLLAGIALALCSVSAAKAHGISVDCVVQPPDIVLVTVNWGGHDPAGGAAIRVLDKDGIELAAGTCDEEGQYSFIASATHARSFEATIAGHRAVCTLTPAQLAQLGIPSDPPLVQSPPHDDPDAVPGEVHPSDHVHETGHEPSSAPHEHEPATHEHPPSPAVDHHTDGDDGPADGGHPGADSLSPTVPDAVAGLALILAVAALIMVMSLRREFREFVKQTEIGRAHV